jgi:hypothetical protein
MKGHARCGTMTVRLDGVVDPRAIASTLARVAELSCDDVVVDLGLAREISNVALALLARGLARFPRSHVVIRGLDRDHERVLEHLGAGSLVARPDASPRR